MPNIETQKRAHRRAALIIAYIGAVETYAFIISVAVTHHPAGWFALYGWSSKNLLHLTPVHPWLKVLVESQSPQSISVRLHTLVTREFYLLEIARTQQGSKLDVCTNE